MKIKHFPESNITFARDQPEYQPLPAFYVGDNQGIVISCWSLSIKERIKVLFTGCIWLHVLTFNNPLQPQLMQTDYPFIRKSIKDKILEALTKKRYFFKDD